MKSLDNPNPGEVIMSKVLVLYHSDSGNTANMAQYVAEQFTLHYGAVLAGEPRKDKEGKPAAGWAGDWHSG